MCLGEGREKEEQTTFTKQSGTLFRAIILKTVLGDASEKAHDSRELFLAREKNNV